MPIDGYLRGAPANLYKLDFFANGNQFSSVTDLTYSQAITQTKLEGVHALGVGFVVSGHDATCSFSLLQIEGDELIATLGPGYAEVAFDATAQLLHAPVDGGPSIDSLVGCRISAYNKTVSAEGATVEVQLTCREILIGGIPAIL